jgi:multiphosphoryl transfer protein
MLELPQSNIQLEAQVANKEQAIRAVGDLLVQNQFIRPGYVESMLGREKVANTYLGNGISIPHGLPKDRELILRTGIAVLQVPQGVEWNPGEKATLVVGIAARSDEHLELLANLTHVLGDEQTVQRLSTTRDSQDIIQALTRLRDEKAAPAAQAPQLEAYSNYVEVKVAGVHGLHARPATMFVDLAKQFSAEVHVAFNGKIANGKSLVSLLKLGIESGKLIRIMAKGADEETALQALKEAVEAGLGDSG